MKYEDPAWPTIIQNKLKETGLRQIDLVNKIKMRPQAVHALLSRSKIMIPTIIRLSHAFQDDLTVHYLANETKVVLNKAREAGVSTGEENELLAWRAEMERMNSLIEQQKEELARKDEEARKLQDANEELKNLLGGVQKEFENLAKAKEKEQKTKDHEIDELKEAKRTLEIDSNLRIAVLEGKLEILQGK